MPSTYRVYASNERSDDLSIMDAGQDKSAESTKVGKRPRGIRVSPDRHTIYVALSGSPIGGPNVDEKTLPPPDPSADGIAIVDATRNRLVKIIHGGPDPEQFDVSADGAFLYVANESSSSLSVVDVTAGVVTHSVHVGAEPEGVKITPDSKFVYVTSESESTVSVVDTNSLEVVKTFKVAARPRSVAFSSDGMRAYVACELGGTLTEVDAVQHVPLRQIQVGPAGTVFPMTVVLSPDSKLAYVSTGRAHKIVKVDIQRGEVVGAVEVGGRPWGIALSPDGKTLYTANGPSNNIGVIDLATFTVTKRISVGNGPWGVVTVAR
jgi:YVTN family beta-propeller protein